MQFNKKVFWVILLATILRLFLAYVTELGNDEVYYITYALKLQWNYFDHPPLVGLLIKLTTLNLWLTSEVFVRLGPILLAAVNTYLVYTIGTNLKDERTGFFAALLYSASPYTSIIAGVFIMPDAPMLFFWILSLYLILKMLNVSVNKNKANIYLLLVGTCIGLAAMGKVHAVFLWIGLGLYIILFDRKWLKNPYLYLAAIISACIVSPILIWNINNDFITYKFQGERVSIHQGFRLDSLLTEFIGGILYNGPFNYLLIIAAIIALMKHKLSISKQNVRILLSMSLPLIITLLFVSSFRSTLPHWSGPAFVPLMLIAAIYISSIFTIWQIKILQTSWIFLLCVGLLGAYLINNYSGTIGSETKEKYGKGDVTLDMYGWHDFSQKFKKIVALDKESGKMQINSFIVSNKWFPSAHLDFYVARPNHLPFQALGTLNDIHHYYWLNEVRLKLKTGDDAYIIVPSTSPCEVEKAYVNYFKIIEKPEIIPQYRGRKLVRYFYIYRAHDYLGDQI